MFVRPHLIPAGNASACVVGAGAAASRGTGRAFSSSSSSAAELVVAFASIQIRQSDKLLKLSGGDWVTGQPKVLFASFANAHC